MQTRTELERYSPNVRKNDMRRHMKSPASHDTVAAQPISNGIMSNATSKSAIAKWVSIVSILDGRLYRRFSRRISTVIFPMDDKIISILKINGFP